MKLIKNYSAFNFYESTPDESSMLISKFPNTGSPPDKILTLIYKKMSHILAPVISEMINISFMEVFFSICLKIGRVVPIFKSCKKTR